MNKKPEIENKQPKKIVEITHEKRRTSQGEIFQRQKTATHDKHVGASKKKSTQRTLKDIYPTFNAFEF